MIKKPPKKGFPEGQPSQRGRCQPKADGRGITGNPEGSLPCVKGGVCKADGGIVIPYR